MKKFVAKTIVWLFLVALVILLFLASIHFLGLEATLVILSCIGMFASVLWLDKFVDWLFNDKENKNEKG